MFYVRSGVVKRMNQILRSTNDSTLDPNHNERINYLCLDSLAKICVNHEGK